MEKQWYEELFENYGQQYDKESFTRGTSGECDFIEQEIDYNKNCRILDLGCGTGRHSLELTKRGYTVLGVDLSDSQLNRAREKAKEQNLVVKFQKQDARKLSFKDEFDLVIMLCEGAFPLMETDEMNFEILKRAARALREPGKIILTTLNALFPLYNSVEEFCASDKQEGNAEYRENRFDLMTLRDYNITVVEDDLGQKKELKCSERYYMPSEISWLLKNLGYKRIDIFGAKLGAFSRTDNLTTNDFEMLVIAEK